MGVKIKRKSNGSIEKYKARHVAKDTSRNTASTLRVVLVRGKVCDLPHDYCDYIVLRLARLMWLLYFCME